MKIAFLNPNATVAMTESIVATARASLPDAQMLGWTNTAGPAAIQGEADGERALPGVLELVSEAERAGVDAIVMACFDDVGLEAARAQTALPTIGIGQASYHVATLSAGRFTVLTTLDVSVPVITQNIERQGFDGVCRKVVASGIPVLDIEAGRPETLDRLRTHVRQLGAEPGAGSIVLGCAGMSRYRGALQAVSNVPVIGPVQAATVLAHAMALGSNPSAA